MMEARFLPWFSRCLQNGRWILKEINPQYSLEGLMLKLKLQYFGHLIQRGNSLEKTLMLGKTEGRRRRGWQWMGWLGGITDSMDMNLNKIQKMVEDRFAWHPKIHGIAKSLTQFSNWTTTTSTDGVYYFLLLSTVFMFLCPYQTGISA